jgi:hypothetical protein
VIYISSEGQADLKFRIAAWENTNKVLADEAPFFLIRQSINFMQAEDVDKLVATIAAIVEAHSVTPVAVFVDTVSRVLPGADENLQKDMTLFVAACDAVRQRFGATVIGVHHTSRQGNLRGSTVFDGAGDFLAQIERDEGEPIGSLKARKIKAAADGWENKFRLDKVDLPLGHSSLVARLLGEDEAPRSDEREKWMPETRVCRLILAAMDEAWMKGEPWSNQPNTKKLLYAPKAIASRFGMTVKDAEKLIDKWLHGDAALIKVACRSPKGHVYGIQVTGKID